MYWLVIIAFFVINGVPDSDLSRRNVKPFATMEECQEFLKVHELVWFHNENSRVSVEFACMFMPEESKQNRFDNKDTSL